MREERQRGRSVMQRREGDEMREKDDLQSAKAALSCFLQAKRDFNFFRGTHNQKLVSRLRLAWDCGCVPNRDLITNVFGAAVQRKYRLNSAPKPRRTEAQSQSVCIRRSLHSFLSLSLTLNTLFLSFLSSIRVILNLRRIPRTPSLSGTSPRIYFRSLLLPLLLLRSH
uniref:Uncharacterized protein n=1 Tax=Salix viminalis TaxID=40686 RepID=A0A6N2LJL3_SALVM